MLTNDSSRLTDEGVFHQRVISPLIPRSGCFLNPFQPFEQISGFHGERDANKMGSIPSNIEYSRF